MAVNMIDLILPICAAKAEHLVEWDYLKGARAFRRKLGDSSWVELAPGWHFPRGLPKAGAHLNISVGNTVFEKTYKRIFGEKAPFLFGTQFHILDRNLLNMRRHVIERGSWLDVPGKIQFPERTFYHDELDGWLDAFITTGWRLVQGRFDLSSDAAILAGLNLPNVNLHAEPIRLMVEIMLGNRTAASDFLRTPTFAAAGPRDGRAVAMLEKLADAEASVPAI